MLKGLPCRIVEHSTYQPGKHGHAKAHLVGIDLFTGKKLEEVARSSQSIQAWTRRRSFVGPLNRCLWCL